MEQLWNLLGHLHPVVVHLPIGIFILLAVVELAGLFPRGPRLSAAQRTLVLAVGLIFALAAVLFGWLLARDGGYDAAQLERHRWLGLSFAAGAALLLAARHQPRLYATLLGATVILLGAAGHFGGSLTHGENYLTLGSAPAKPVVFTTPGPALVFDDVVQPLLQQRCAACHGATKSNGDLRLDALEPMLKGGKTGLAFKAGDTAASAMIKRAHLPLDAKEHMPPKGKPQLTDDELALLEWWIDAGAPAAKRVADVNPPPAIVELIATRLGIPPLPPPDRATMLAAAEKLERHLGILIRPLTADQPWLEVNARLQFARFGDAQLAAFAPIAPAIHRLDLGETAVTDAGLASLAAMKNLRRLHLDRTAVTDRGLEQLSALSYLESLDLHTTKVTDQGLIALRPLSRLRTLYLWQTQVTPAAVADFSARQVDRRKLDRLRSQLTAVESAIRAEHFSADLGASLPPVAAKPEKAPMAARPAEPPAADSPLK